MTATPRYYPAEDAPRTKKVVAKVQNVSLAHSNGNIGMGCVGLRVCHQRRGRGLDTALRKVVVEG